MGWIAEVTAGRILNLDPSVKITGFCIDSRNLKPGDFFVALAGKTTDGHLFLAEAFGKGASGALICQDKLLPKTHLHSFPNIVEVADTKSGLQKLAKAYRQYFQIPIIGITGSSGKTTTKELLWHILNKRKAKGACFPLARSKQSLLLAGARSKRFSAYRSPGNLNTEYGLPLALLHMPSDTAVGIFELGVQQKGEIKELADILQPTIGMITNVGDAHLSFFHHRARIAQAKWELIERLPPDGLAVLNYDSPYLKSRISKYKRVIGFGLKAKDAAYVAKDINDESLSGVSFKVHSPKGRFEINSKLLGKYNIYNILAAIAVAVELGVEVEAIQKAVQEFKPFPGRMELKRSKKLGIILDDSYNASPFSTKEALLTLAKLEVTGKRKIFVFGDMLELGAKAVAAHKDIAKQIAKLGIDLVFTLGDLARETGLALIKEGWSIDRVKITESRQQLKAKILAAIKDNQNLILVKGSRKMELDKLVEELF